jgi:DNA-binding NarL/FixJ family response regulator
MARGEGCGSIGRMTPETIRVAVVEDDGACRTALAHALQAAPDMRVQWLAASRAEALERLDEDLPLDVLLLDLGLPDGSGLDVLAALRRRWPQAAAMVSTIFGDEAHVLGAIEAGAMGYLLKDLPPQAVLQEVRGLHAGGSPINPLVARKLLVRRQWKDAMPPAQPPTPALAEAAPSAREAELLRRGPRPSPPPCARAGWNEAESASSAYPPSAGSSHFDSFRTPNPG